MGHLEYRRAQSADSDALCALMRETPMGRSIRVIVERGKGFFAGSRVQAEKPEVWGAFEPETGRVAGLFAAGARRVFLGGGIREVRYLSDLRIRPEYRSGLVLARGYRILRDRVFADGEWAQTLILDDNAEAKNVLASGRAGLPEYRPCGHFRTWFLRGQKVRGADSRFEVRHARSEDLPAMQALLEAEGPRAQFTPWVDFRMLKDVGFRLAFHGAELLGLLGIWDTSTFRSARVESYSRTMGLVRPLWNAWAKLRKAPPLPAPGRAVPVKALTAVLCRDRDPAILRALLSSVLEDAGTVFAIMLDEADPLATALCGMRAHQTTSSHYLVGFSGEPPRIDGPLYFDFARL